ncbi:MAG TPA: hypothetical protein VJ673_01975 [Aromatoleum sp.]|uniref:hypothetical protein n=1 Tax=Aromatoleum sp. TaxID=2307007 RepID=UPI002B4777D0|nr:hypothetical protein [Aromatoleum sp.]HJV24417.1 hypothetical protein [Aromatoleum sp.]
MRPIFAVLGARVLGALAAHPASRRERLRFFLMVMAGKKGWRGARPVVDALDAPPALAALGYTPAPITRRESPAPQRDTEAGATGTAVS